MVSMGDVPLVRLERLARYRPPGPWCRCKHVVSNLRAEGNHWKVVKALQVIII